MNGPDHYCAADSRRSRIWRAVQPRAVWCLELAKLRTALPQVAATALNSDSREWGEVAGRKFNG